MDSSKVGNMTVLRKSGHEWEAEDETMKRRKIDADGVAELQRLEGKGDGEKMDVDEIREGEVVKKRDDYLEDWQQRVDGESSGGECGCAAAKMDPGAEYQRTAGECHDSSDIQMEVEASFLHREAAKKGDQKREVGDEAVKNIEHGTGKMDQINECEAGKVDAKAEERKRRLAEYEQWRKRKEKELDEEVAARDPEELTDFHAFHARSFERRWNGLHANRVYGSFHDKSECLLSLFSIRLTIILLNHFILPNTINI